MGVPFPKLLEAIAAAGTLPQRIRSMFAGGEQGAWYDPSDLSTMFSDSGGSAAITTTGQTVALILDKRFGLALGPALNFSGAWTASGADISGTDATVTATNPAAIRSAQLNVGLVNAQWYEVIYTISNRTAGDFYVDPGGAAHGNTSRTANGTYREIRRATPNQVFYVVASAGAIGTLTINSVKTITGNHAYQTASASRPIFRDVGGLRYLEFDGVDDYLRSTFTIAQPIDRISAIQQVTWTVDDFIFGGVAANAGVLYQQSPSPNLNAYSGLFVGATSSCAIGVNAVITERHSGASSRLAVNALAYITGNAGTNVPGGITLGTGDSGPPGFGNCRIHQVIMRGSTTAMTDAQIAACRALCAIKSGVTL